MIDYAYVNWMLVKWRAFSCGRILHQCLRVLYKQLAAWMLHGMLLDQFTEFFIRQVDEESRSGSAEAVAEDELGLGGVTGRQMAQILVIAIHLKQRDVGRIFKNLYLPVSRASVVLYFKAFIIKYFRKYLSWFFMCLVVIINRMTTNVLKYFVSFLILWVRNTTITANFHVTF